MGILIRILSRNSGDYEDVTFHLNLQVQKLRNVGPG